MNSTLELLIFIVFLSLTVVPKLIFTVDAKIFCYVITLLFQLYIVQVFSNVGA